MAHEDAGGFQRHCDASISKTINFPETANARTSPRSTGWRSSWLQGRHGLSRTGAAGVQPMALKRRPRNRRQEQQAQEAAAAAPEPVPATPREIEPADLPEIVSGLRIRQMTPFGNMHVKITVDPREQPRARGLRPARQGRRRRQQRPRGLCRVASLWLRSGGSLQHVIKQLGGIGSSLQIPTRNGRIMSLPDGLACALKKYLGPRSASACGPCCWARSTSRS
jgi:ribonucleotide reductase alpha subunit